MKEDPNSMTKKSVSGAGAVAVAKVTQKVAEKLLGSALEEVISMGHPIATAVINETAYDMSLIPGIHTHHGQYIKSPTPTLKKIPDTPEDEEKEHGNIVVVSMKATLSGTGGAAEAIFGYEFQKDDKTYQACFYLKHGHHLESGSALWEKDKEVDGEKYSTKIHKAAESLIHTIQKRRQQTSYSKDGEGASVTVDGIKISHTSGESFEFYITPA